MDQNTFEPQVSSGSQGQPASRRALILIVVGVVVLAAIIAGVWWMSRDLETSKEIAPGQTMVTPPKGRIVTEFPQELILEKGVTVSDSYRLEYAAGNANQPVVVYDSALTVSENLMAYREYFTKNGWNMLQEGDPIQLPATFVYAVKDGAEVNVTLESLPPNKTRVHISYLIKK